MATPTREVEVVVENFARFLQHRGARDVVVPPRAAEEVLTRGKCLVVAAAPAAPGEIVRAPGEFGGVRQFRAAVVAVVLRPDPDGKSPRAAVVRKALKAAHQRAPDAETFLLVKDYAPNDAIVKAVAASNAQRPTRVLQYKLFVTDFNRHAHVLAAPVRIVPPDVARAQLRFYRMAKNKLSVLHANDPAIIWCGGELDDVACISGNAINGSGHFNLARVGRVHQMEGARS